MDLRLHKKSTWITLRYTGQDTKANETLREPDPKCAKELWHAQDGLKRELVISQWVKALTLEEIDLGNIEDPRPIKIAKELTLTEKSVMVDLLKEYQDVFSWSYSDM